DRLFQMRIYLKNRISIEPKIQSDRGGETSNTQVSANKKTFQNDMKTLLSREVNFFVASEGISLLSRSLAV
ncbi:hypothetical protein, partial [Halorubrum sp. SP9]|uniref:hypothetical protein n=1 Tax=Halorubrum sp. SP9 TaxID=1537267 RepID=UPI001A7E0CAB